MGRELCRPEESQIFHSHVVLRMYCGTDRGQLRIPGAYPIPPAASVVVCAAATEVAILHDSDYVEHWGHDVCGVVDFAERAGLDAPLPGGSKSHLDRDNVLESEPLQLWHAEERGDAARGLRPQLATPDTRVGTPYGWYHVPHAGSTRCCKPAGARRG